MRCEGRSRANFFLKKWLQPDTKVMGKNLFRSWKDEILQDARKRASGNASSGNCKWSAIPPWRGIGQTGGRTQPSNQLSHPWPATIAADVRFNKGDSVLDNLGKEEVSFSPCVTSLLFRFFMSIHTDTPAYMRTAHTLPSGPFTKPRSLQLTANVTTLLHG